jgi:site-specific DNA recombinase
MRTVIYARFSSTLQNDRSAEDQIALCRARCRQEGWEIVDVCKDEALSGALGAADRPGLARALALIEAGEAEQLLAESTDRISRHQGDAFAVRERLDYAGARLFTLMDGEVDEITGLVKGLFDQRFRKDLGARIRRGQAGAVAEGRSPAGIAYGYRSANRIDGQGRHVRGLREIDPDQAAIVLRIFTEFAEEGRSTHAIAGGLNADGVPAPRGGGWRTSTILGDARRGHGILRNRLYAGEIVHARTAKKMDPRARRYRIHANESGERPTAAVPHLRIVDEDLWQRAQERIAQHSNVAPHRARRPKRLLSGLARCGVCGGAWSVIGRERWGCSAYRDGRACSNNRTIMTHLLEARVLEGLRSQMLHPETVSAYVAEFHRGAARQAAEAERERARLQRAERELAGRIDNLVRAIERGADIEEVREALARARTERSAIAAQLQDIDALPVIPLHPGIAEDYRRKFESVAGAFTGDEAAQRHAMPTLRSLIDRVAVAPHPEKARGVAIEVTGRLAALLALARGRPAPEAHEHAMYVNDGAGSGNRTRITSLEG